MAPRAKRRCSAERSEAFPANASRPFARSSATPTATLGPVSEASADGALFEAAFRQAAIGMALLEQEGRWLQVNDALSQTLGYASSEELMGADVERTALAEPFAPSAEERAGLLDGSAKSVRY